MKKTNPKPEPVNAPKTIMHPEQNDDDARDTALRPRTLDEFLGQKAMKENLSVFIEAARARNESLDHLFLIGPPGLGKTTLAQVVANELGVDFKVTSAPALVVAPARVKGCMGILMVLALGP